MLKAFLLFVLPFFCAIPAMAQTDIEFVNPDEVLGFIKFSNLQVDDGIEGNCWTNSSTVESRIRLLLEQNEISVLDYQPAFRNLFTPLVYVGTLGYRTEGGICVGSIELTVLTYFNNQYGPTDTSGEYSFSAMAELFSRSGIASSGTNLNDQYEDFLVGWTSDFLAEVISNRRNPKVEQFFTSFPWLAEEPYSQAKWDKLIEEGTSAE